MYPAGFGKLYMKRNTAAAAAVAAAIAIDPEWRRQWSYGAGKLRIKKKIALNEHHAVPSTAMTFIWFI